MRTRYRFSKTAILLTLLFSLAFTVLLASCGSESSTTVAPSGGTTDITTVKKTDVTTTVKTDVTTTVKTDVTTTGGNMGTEAISVSKLTINQTELPLGIDSDAAFGWTLKSTVAANAQTAYQIKVYSSEENYKSNSADMWDSGKVDSSNSTSVAYGGKKLASTSTYFWTVTVWDSHGNSVTSALTEFRTGVFEGDSWKGSWISAPENDIDYDLSGAKWIWYSGKNNKTSADGGLAAESNFFRGKFTVDTSKKVKTAVFIFTGDDYGTLYVNGRKALTVENSTDIWKKGNVVDITEVIESGENVIAAEIINSSVGYAGFVGKLFIEYTDGSKTTFATNNSWKVSKTSANNWTAKSFDDSLWKAPDQYVSYGSSPWGDGVAFTNEGDRAAVLLRKEFTAKSDIVEATVYMSGIGYSILSINGTLADDCFLDPCNTQYNKTVLYRTFDVTELVKSGENAIAVELGNGFYNEESGVWNWGTATWKDSPKLLYYMIVKYADGTSETVLSDESWTVTTNGPTRFNSIYYGEFYDARLEKNGWDKVGYDDSDWTKAVLAEAPTGKLECQLEEPVRRTEEFEPEKIRKLSDGSYIVYVPEMVAGWIKLDIEGAKAGDVITITYGEKLNSDGSVQKLGGGDGVNGHWWSEYYIMTDKYTSAGAASETFEPKFSYKGFEYIQIWGYPGELTADDITIYRIRNDVEITGVFESSNELINKLHAMMVRTCLNNLQGKPTDTPVWEKNGWLGDFNVALATMNYNFDMALMTENFVEIMESCYEQYGLVPPMVPTAGWNIGENYVWNTVYVFAVAENYKTYGSLEYVKEQYDTMASYAKRVSRKISTNKWVCPDGQLGDWVSPMGKNQNASYVESASEGSGIVGTALIYKMFDELAIMAELLGETSDAATYRSYMAKIYTAFNEKYFNEEKKIYETTHWTQYGTRTKYRQTSNIMPLAFGLVPEEHREAVIANLIDDIESKGNHLDTGCVGSKYILPVLTELGYEELAYTILTQETYPSWGFMIKRGSTSLWEMWETTSRSLGHYFLGTYDEWLFAYLAGVRNINNGYETFTVAPLVVGDLTYVTCKLDTVRGELESSWVKADDGTVTMTVTVPVGSTATVIIPLENASEITVNGEKTTGSELTLKSGTYTIICK